MDKYNDLSQYKMIHGHSNVHRKDKNNNQLALWVKNQRNRSNQ